MRPSRFLLALSMVFGILASISTAVVAQTIPPVRLPETISPVQLPEIRFVSTPTRLGVANQEYRYQARAVGRDTLAALRYRLTEAPLGMTIDSINGLVRWTTTAGTTTPVRVSILAALATSDSSNVTQAFALIILPVTAAQPTVRFPTTAPTTASVGVAYTYQASAFYGLDPLLAAPSREQKERIQYSLLNAPQGMTIDASGTVQWIPTANGTVNFSIRAVSTTVATASATQNVEVSVTEPRPIFVTSPRPQAFVGREYVYEALAVLPMVSILPDTAGTRFGEIVVLPIAQRVPMTYTLVTAPDGMTVESTSGVVRWTPTTLSTTTTVRVVLRASVAGVSTIQTVTQEFVLRVAGDSTTQTVTREFVLPLATDPSQSLPFIIDPGSLYADVGQEFVYRASAQASPPTTATIVYSLGEMPPGARIDSLTGEIRWTPTTAGLFIMEIIARLPNGTPRTAEVRQRFRVYARANVCGLVQGVVRYTDGTVVVNGTLRALVTNVTAASLGGSPFYYYTATIRNGVYSLPIGAGSYILSVSDADFNEAWFAGSPTNTSATVTTPDRAVPITVRCGDTLTYIAVVPRRPAARFFAVSGRVTRLLDGAAVVSMIEAIGDADPALINSGIIRRTALTDAQGNYQLTQLDNRYIYTFRALPYERRSTTASVQAPQLLPQYFDNTLNLTEARKFRLSADVANINFVLQERPTFNNGITGKVQSTTGVGIPGRIIAFMTSATADTLQYASVEVRTEDVDSTGAFNLRNLTPGEYVLQAFPNNEREYASGYYSAGTTATTRWSEATRVNVGTANTEGITIALARLTTLVALAATVSGTVSTEAGAGAESVAGASVYMLNESGDVVGQTLTDKHGYFDAGMVGYGKFTLIVDKPGYANATAQVVAEKPSVIEKSIILQKPVSAVLTSVSGSAPFVQTLGITPNPVSESAFIQIPPFAGTARLAVMNMRGEEVFTTEISSANTMLQLDASNLPNGVYIVRIAGETIRATARMLIAR